MSSGAGMTVTREPIGDVTGGCLCCPPRPGVLPLDACPHPWFGLLDLLCDGEPADGWFEFCDWGYWAYSSGGRAVVPNSRVLGWRALPGRDDLCWEKRDKQVTLREIEEAVADDPDHDWCLRIEGPLSGAVYQRQGCGQWVAVERLEGFA